MVQRTLSKSQAPPWFWIGLGLLTTFSLAIRFWGLDRFNTLVFDEVYFAKFGYNYVTHTPFFDAHPPLGKYLIGLGIWLKGYHPWGYRWMNALFGAVIPLAITGLGYQLTHRYGFALIAGVLMALDGLLLVESRYGLINVYLLLFGILGQWFLLRSAQRKGTLHWFWLTSASLSFGAAAAVKWNSLGFLLGLYFLWGGLRLADWRLTPSQASSPSTELPLVQLKTVSPLKLFGYLPLIGGIFYSLLLTPHLLMHAGSQFDYSFQELHSQMYGYHKRIESGPGVHPYCSVWYQWPLLLRPVSYFYQRAASLAEPMPVNGAQLPMEQTKVIYSVYAMGNPPLWWLTTVAIAVVLSLALWQVITFLRNRSEPIGAGLSGDLPLCLYFAAGYLANLLPWLSISRCAFLYHYMPAYLFASFALAWLLSSWFSSPERSLQMMGGSLLLLCVGGLVFWLPIFLGLPLSPAQWQWRVFLPSWV
jgi:dolichyl-phosphate-mannose--protein O-mannosyl transferase